jgi:hypothetical protein
MSIDPAVATTDQPYVFTNDNPLNAEDPVGLDPVVRNYPKGNLQDEITRYLGSDVSVKSGRSGDKVIFYDKNDPSKEVVYDVDENYYRTVRVVNGEEEYYDSANSTWGTNENLGNEGLQNSHYANSGDSYNSVADAAQAFGDGASGDGGAGDGAGDFGGMGLYLVFPNMCAFVKDLCKPLKPVKA